MRINAKGQQALYLAQGDSVRLGCPYILDPEDNGPNNLDIIWTMVNPNQRLPVSLESCPSSYFLSKAHQTPGWNLCWGLFPALPLACWDTLA